MNKFCLPQLNIQNIGILQILLNGCVQTNLLNIVAHPLQEIDGQINVNVYIHRTCVAHVLKWNIRDGWSRFR